MAATRVDSAAAAGAPEVPATALPGAGGASPSVEPGAGTPAQPESFNFDEWSKTAPKEALDEVWNRALGFVDRSMREQYAEVVPLMERAAKDEGFRKKLARLSDEKLAAYYDVALDTYDKMYAEASPAVGADAPLTDEGKRLKALEDTIAAEKSERTAAAYRADRQREFAALSAEVPDLRFESENDRSYAYAMHLVQIAEDRSALTGKRVSYKDVYDEDQRIRGAEQAPTIPATSATRVPPQQAPRDATEARQRMIDTINKAGGVRKLAAVASARSGR